MPARILNDRTATESTVRIFDSFYDWNYVAPAAEYDVVNSYFLGKIADRQIAQNFTAFVFMISNQTGLNPLELIDYLENRSQLEMNQVIAYYLNSFKNMASLYGVAIKPQVNQFVARNIAV